MSGWREATKVALEALEKASTIHSGSDTDRHSDPGFKAQLLNIARTTLSSKLLTHHKEHFAKLAVDAILRLKGSGNLDAIQVCFYPYICSYTIASIDLFTYHYRLYKSSEGHCRILTLTKVFFWIRKSV